MPGVMMVPFPIPEVRGLARRALMRAGLPPDDARLVTEVYLEAELWGRKSHGLRLIPWSLEQMKGRAVGAISIEHETPVSALLDGVHRHGCAVAHRAMTLAIAKARQAGIGLVGVRRAGNIGMLGYYVRLAATEGFIGLTLAHTGPGNVVPHGGAEPLLGTNPLAVGVPARPHPVILDMATSAVSYHQLRLAQAAGRQLPPDAALDTHGRPTTDPREALAGGLRLLPFGGPKGSGLSLMIEVLAGCWTNSPVGTEKAGPVRSELFGSLFAAAQPELLMAREAFESRVQALIRALKASKAAAGFAEVHLPGERSQQRRDRALAAGIIEVEEATAAFLQGEG